MESFCGKEFTKEINGTTYTFSRWTLAVLDAFTDFARTQLPDPVKFCTKVIEEMMAEEAAMPDTPALPAVLERRNKIKDELVKAAIDKASSYLAFTSPEVRSLINSPRGSAELLRLLLKAHHPDITREQAFDLANSMPEDVLEEIMTTTSGLAPPSVGNGSGPEGSRLPVRAGSTGTSSKSRFSKRARGR